MEIDELFLYQAFEGLSVVFETFIVYQYRRFVCTTEG